MKFINLYQNLINLDHSLKNIKSLIKKNQFIGGPEISKFENNFSKFAKSKYCISVANGTDALEIALKALGVKKSDEVIIPNFTIISNALAVIKLNATPVLVDCNQFNWNMIE